MLIALVSPGCSKPDGGNSPAHRSLWEFASAAADGSESDVVPRFATLIRKPTGPPVIELKEPDPQGRIGVIACSTCHSVREPNPANRAPADLDQFHLSMEFAHGKLTCLSCHNPQDYDTLRLADETTVEYPEVMTLCAQCHGPQATAYEHGAHGGMSGYWDLSRGPRTRNNCIDCHDPHQPKFPSMVPTFKPRDRFLDAAPAHQEHLHD
ncbi:MAG: cytochrome c3 family protein [Aeoliella sp.]